MTFDAFHALSVPELRALAQSLRDGALAQGGGHVPLQQIAGLRASTVAEAIGGLRRQGFSSAQIALLVSAMEETRERIPDPGLVFELVLSGPPLQDIPTRHTGAVVRTLFAEAAHEVLVAGYAIHQGEDIFSPLHQRMLAVPSLAVRLCFDIRRKDLAVDQDTIDAFAHEFNAKHWPWPEQPELFFFPRSMEPAPGERGSLHAKCVIVDRRIALITSANFTEAAQIRNIEAGVLIKFEPMVARLGRYFDGLVAGGHLQQVNISGALLKCVV